jgi:hypothetical protein
MVESQHGDIELVWLEQLGADLRARTQAEYLYTAAAVAAFGGVCWGVAAQQNCCLGYVAVLAIGLLAVAVWRKIWNDHKVYKDIWRDRVRIVGKLSQRPNSTDIFPDRIKGEPGHGYRSSIAVLLAAAGGAILFCLVFAMDVSVCLWVQDVTMRALHALARQAALWIGR